MVLLAWHWAGKCPGFPQRKHQNLSDFTRFVCLSVWLAGSENLRLDGDMDGMCAVVAMWIGLDAKSTSRLMLCAARS